MSTVYKSIATRVSTTSITTIYTAPVGRTTLVRSLYCSNITSTLCTIDIVLTKTGQSDLFLIKDADVPPKATFQPITEAIILEPGDILKTTTSSANVVDIILSCVELDIA